MPSVMGEDMENFAEGMNAHWQLSNKTSTTRENIMKEFKRMDSTTSSQMSTILLLMKCGMTFQSKPQLEPNCGLKGFS